MMLSRLAIVGTILTVYGLAFAWGGGIASVSAGTDSGSESSGLWSTLFLVVVGLVASLLVTFLIALISRIRKLRKMAFAPLLRALDSGAGRYAIFVMLMLVVSGVLCGIFWRDLEGSNDPPLGTTIRNVILMIAGVLALPLAVWRGYVAEQQVKATQESVDAAQEAIANQRFQAAAQMLGHDLSAVRLGAIHTLADMGRQDPARNHVNTARLLAAFVRRPREDDSTSIDYMSLQHGEAIREDVYTALVMLVTREDQAIGVEIRQGYRINLEGQDFRDMDVTGWNLSRMDLRGADFSGVDLKDIDSSDSDLSRCTFTSAKLHGANLENARLSGTNFTLWRIEDNGKYSDERNGPGAHPVLA